MRLLSLSYLGKRLAFALTLGVRPKSESHQPWQLYAPEQPPTLAARVHAALPRWRRRALPAASEPRESYVERAVRERGSWFPGE